MDFEPNKIDLLNQEQLNLCYKFAIDKSASFTLSHFTGKAIVCFQYQHYRDYLVRMHEQDDDFLKINNYKIKVSQAAKPGDMFWYNMKVSDQERRLNKIYSYIVLGMLLILCFAMLLGLEILRLSFEK